MRPFRLIYPNHRPCQEASFAPFSVSLSLSLSPLSLTQPNHARFGTVPRSSKNRRTRRPDGLTDQRRAGAVTPPMSHSRSDNALAQDQLNGRERGLCRLWNGTPASRRGVAFKPSFSRLRVGNFLPPSRCKWRPVGSHAAARSGALSAKSAVVRSVRPSRVSYREGNLMRASGRSTSMASGDQCRDRAMPQHALRLWRLASLPIIPNGRLPNSRPRFLRKPSPARRVMSRGALCPARRSRAGVPAPGNSWHAPPGLRSAERERKGLTRPWL
jgi:hypothetical protein